MNAPAASVRPALSDEDIDRIAHGLLDCTLPKPEWTHAAHFAAALFLLRAGLVQPVEGSMAPMIRAFNEATGTPNTDTSGYHETITLASLSGAAAMLRQTADEPLERVLATLLAGPLGQTRWPLHYWSERVLMSAEARRCWVAPDREPLPW